MVLSAGPVYKPQYRMRGLPQCTPHLVLRGRCIQRLDVQRFPPVGTWETYVLIVTLAQLLITLALHAKLVQGRAFFGLSSPIRCHPLQYSF